MKKIKYIEKQFLFSENQRFRQIWIRIGFVLMPVVTLLYALFYTSRSVNQSGYSTMPGPVVILLAIIFGIALPMLFYFAELRVRITSDGLFVKFFPFQLSWEFYSHSEIKRFEKVQYHPLREYGGWGIRYGLHGKAFNVSGNMGIKLTFLNSKKLLIGSQKPDEFESVLQKIKNAGS